MARRGKKWCTICGDLKPRSEIRKDSSQCKPCYRGGRRQYDARRYVEHRGEVLAYRERLRKQAAAFVNSLKQNTPCVDCGGIFPPYVMDFDHVLGAKVGNVAIAMSWSWDRLLTEIAKCDIVCSNCHRERTYQRQKLINEADLTDAEEREA